MSWFYISFIRQHSPLPPSLDLTFQTDPPQPATPWQGDRSLEDSIQTVPRLLDQLATLWWALTTTRRIKAPAYLMLSRQFMPGYTILCTTWNWELECSMYTFLSHVLSHDQVKQNMFEFQNTSIRSYISVWLLSQIYLINDEMHAIRLWKETFYRENLWRWSMFSSWSLWYRTCQTLTNTPGNICEFNWL